MKIYVKGGKLSSSRVKFLLWVEWSMWRKPTRQICFGNIPQRSLRKSFISGKILITTSALIKWWSVIRLGVWIFLVQVKTVEQGIQRAVTTADWCQEQDLSSLSQTWSARINQAPSKKVRSFSEANMLILMTLWWIMFHFWFDRPENFRSKQNVFEVLKEGPKFPAEIYYG